jgi:hypothetical protein
VWNTLPNEILDIHEQLSTYSISPSAQKIDGMLNGGYGFTIPEFDISIP